MYLIKIFYEYCVPIISKPEPPFKIIIFLYSFKQICFNVFSFYQQENAISNNHDNDKIFNWLGEQVIYIKRCQLNL